MAKWFEFKPFQIPGVPQPIEPKRRSSRSKPDKPPAPKKGRSRSTKSSVPPQSNSPYYRPGQRLRYKAGKGQKVSRDLILVVEFHTADGVKFLNMPAFYSAEHFEPVPERV